MQNEMPFYEHPEDALTACVQALGGAKKVGGMLFPDKTAENARDYLLACLNTTRNEKLSVSQILFVFREAKKVGFHAGFEYFAHEAEYDARPISKAEEVDRTIAVIEQSTQSLTRALDQLERLQRIQAVKSA